MIFRRHIFKLDVNDNMWHTVSTKIDTRIFTYEFVPFANISHVHVKFRYHAVAIVWMYAFRTQKEKYFSFFVWVPITRELMLSMKEWCIYRFSHAKFIHSHECVLWWLTSLSLIWMNIKKNCFCRFLFVDADTAIDYSD